MKIDVKNVFMEACESILCEKIDQALISNPLVEYLTFNINGKDAKLILEMLDELNSLQIECDTESNNITLYNVFDDRTIQYWGVFTPEEYVEYFLKEEVL